MSIKELLQEIAENPSQLDEILSGWEAHIKEAGAEEPTWKPVEAKNLGWHIRKDIKLRRKAHIIDLAAFTSLPVDMCFWDSDNIPVFPDAVGRLRRALVNDKRLGYQCNGLFSYDKCSVRLNHWNFSEGKIVTIPAGFRVEIVTVENGSQEYQCDEPITPSGLVAVKFKKKLSNFRYPWEE